MFSSLIRRRLFILKKLRFHLKVDVMQIYRVKNIHESAYTALNAKQRDVPVVENNVKSKKIGCLV